MKPITVTQLNTYIKSILEGDANLRCIYVAGEISNFKHYYKSGHMYFTLKDENSQIKAVMYSFNASRLKFIPEDGMSVICRGRISLYERDGIDQLYVDDMQPDGLGALSVAFEQLKEKLSAEGLFDSSHKKEIPKFPKKIGVATSNMGAAVEDIKNITKRRYPLAELVIAPTVVQGDLAPADIVKSISLLDSRDDIDVIIVGRGGGSIEDLWAFNTEEVARAVYGCKTPIISAVGHETDFTICDFVADLRAETPSAAAEKATPDIFALNSFVSNANSRMKSLLQNRLMQEIQRLDSIREDSLLANFSDFFDNRMDVIESYYDELNDSFLKTLQNNKTKLGNLAGRLDALSPLAVLSRGYGVLTDSRNNPVKAAKNLTVGDEINIKLCDGDVNCIVNEVKINGNDL